MMERLENRTGRIIPLMDRSVGNDAMAVGQAIRAARRESGLTQTQLGELVGLSDRTVREIEKGGGGSSLGAVSAAANALGLHIAAS
ncbi:helix-turn-helix transcriptional regulator [Arthrobacter sp.]|uniref:helix-turn-helix transcriptional regulator n=1 Tax=Arthrobacter sp. TaxID=1667 RepID=UPI003A933F8E